MRWKLILLGGLAFYVAMFLISMATGPVIHEGLLKELYKATASFWRPELQSDPPNMAALMPRWIATGLAGAFIQAGIYAWIEPGFRGRGWQKGLQYGVVLALFGACWGAGYSGIFALPDRLWAVWGLEGFLYYLPGGALLGWLTERFRW